MDYQVVVLSEDADFARMLELEFSYLHLRARSAKQLDLSDRAEVLILDLDSASAPNAEQYEKMIGFSRRPATASEDAGDCSMILRRPFRMSLLRREVLSQTGEGTPMEMPMALPHRAVERRIRLEESTRVLSCDRQSVALSPGEFRMMRCLLQKRGTTVSREELSEVMGPSEANKIDVYICYLRRKTDGLPGGRLIKTVRGKGYMIS